MSTREQLGSRSSQNASLSPVIYPDALDMLFDCTPAPLLLLDGSGHLARSNRAAQEALATVDGPGSPGLGKALRCVHAVQQPGGCGASPACHGCPLHRLVGHTLQTGSVHRRVEVKVTRHAGGSQPSDCYLLLSTAVSHLPEGRRILVCLEDLTPRKQAELQLAQVMEKLQPARPPDQAPGLEAVQPNGDFPGIVGTSNVLQHTLDKIARVAPTSASVLILGETGTGKELIAQAVYQRSARRDRPLITINCASLPPPLIESELFGHVAGAFTGATSDRVGRFELAHRGTIFLDEIAELPIDTQAKLLRVLQDGQFWVLGSSTKTVDVRVIAATNRDLRQAVAAGTFRSDLYYRLAVFPIEVPPLRARRGDIPQLVSHFIEKHQAALGRTFKGVSEGTLRAMAEYDWPGNIRELENVVERAMILSPGSVLQLQELLVSADGSRPSGQSNQLLFVAERNHITRVLDSCGWRIKGQGNAADRLGMKPSTLRSRMQKLGIARPAD